MLEDPVFNDATLAENGLVAVLFGGRECAFTKEFRPAFDAWDAPDGVRKAVKWVVPKSDLVTDVLGIEVTPTVMLFRDGQAVLRRDGRAGAGLDASDLTALADDARPHLAAARGAS